MRDLDLKTNGITLGTKDKEPSSSAFPSYDLNHSDQLLSTLMSLPECDLSLEDYSDSELKTWFYQTLPIVKLHTKIAQELISREDVSSEETTFLEESSNSSTIQMLQDTETYPRNINEDDYDIILDLTTNSLRRREDPVIHSPLDKAELKGIGYKRMGILIRLLNHPNRFITVENTDFRSNQINGADAAALTKTISLLREALGKKGNKNPYIITEPSFGSVRHVYKMNPEWNYLVIKE